MKKETIILLILTLICLFFSGCEGTYFSSQKEFNPDVHKGSEGLRIQMQDNSPPREIYENEDFKLITTVKNIGAYEVQNGIISINYEKDYVELLPTSDRKAYVDLRGKDVYNMWDDEEIIVFDLKTKFLDEKSESHDTLLMLTSCYDYESLASFQVCIDTDVYETNPPGEKVCTISDITSGGQGGPLAITRIEYDITGGEYIKPSFKIYIRNLGKGNIIKYDKKEEACSSSGITEKDFDIIKLENVELSSYSLKNGEIKCSPDTIKLRDREAMLRCYLDVNEIQKNSPSFTTSLKIHLKYGYTQTESILMKILNDPTYDKESKAYESNKEDETDTDCYEGQCCARDLGGICKENCEENCPSGTCVPFYCSGPADRQCCVPSTGSMP